MTGRAGGIVFILGAGASLGAGATASVQGGAQLAIPTQDNFWDIFLRFNRDSRNRRLIESFLFRYFLGYRKAPSRLGAAARREMFSAIDVEEVFTFLSERVRAPSTSPQLRTYALQIWRALVAEIGNVFRRFAANSSTRNVYRAWLTNHFRQGDAVVSFNYDTVFEDSLPLNDCSWYVEVQQKGPRARVPLLKPHGSVNWAEFDGEIYVDERSSSPIVVAPTHLKFVAHGAGNDEPLTGYLDQSAVISSIWSVMERRMKEARALVFIGYSFPVADLYFSSVLRSVLADRETSPRVVVVNPDAVAITTRLKRRFALPEVIQYFDLGQFVNAGRRGVL